MNATEKKAAPKTAATAKAAKVEGIGKCRGKWSACGGINPSKSVEWKICLACTAKRAAAMKAAKPAPTKAPAKEPTRATMESEVAAMKRMKAAASGSAARPPKAPAPARVAHPRVPKAAAAPVAIAAFVGADASTTQEGGQDHSDDA